MSLTIGSISDGNVDELLHVYISRYERQRQDCVALKETIDVDKVRSNILYLAANCPGVIALEEGKIVGCLTGYLIDGFKMDGKGVYCPEIANFAEGSRPAVTFRKLYAAAMEVWKKEHVACHAIAAYSSDLRLREALSLNEFGVHVIDCIRPSTPISATEPAGYSFRGAGPEDIDDYLRLNDALFDHICAPPVSQYYPKRRTREVMLERLIDPARHVWMAYHSSNAIGFIQCDYAVDDVCYSVQYNKTAGISGAFIEPEHRSIGVADRLLDLVLEWCRDNGIDRTSVDFESSNAQAYGFWTRNFEPVVYSYLRRLDARSVA